MKRFLCLLAVIVAVSCLMTACNFTTNFSDGTGNTTMQSAPQVEEMMEALSSGDAEEARTLLHPDVAQNADGAIGQMADYLAGRRIAQMEQTAVTVNTSSGTGGSARQENGAFCVELEDGTVFYMSVVHLANNDGEGFVSFQLVLGLV